MLLKLLGKWRMVYTFELNMQKHFKVISWNHDIKVSEKYVIKETYIWWVNSGEVLLDWGLEKEHLLLTKKLTFCCFGSVRQTWPHIYRTHM